MELHEQLKPREIEILRLMADGLTNREISDQLYIGVETVRWYAKQIYSKLHVSGRKEASEKAQSLGLLDDSPEETPQSEAKHKHNLPIQLTSFIGRETQIVTIKNLLDDARLLTLTGPGGTGKTRLSIRVAESLLDDFADGAYFVDLAPVSDTSMVANAIASALGILETGDLPLIEAIKRAIGQRELLLILDNYEHVIEAAPLVADLLTTAPHIKVIATSREPLRVSGEQMYTVPPLSLSDEHQEAVSLFVQRSQAVKRSFKLNESNSEAVVEICQRLDGMPLAIELAASLSRLLTPEAILARMDNRFQTFKSGSRDAPTRQQTLRNTIDWSYNLLDKGEKILFARLAVFRGGRSLEAIEAVCSDGLPIDIFDGLMSLVDKSMIRQIEDELGEPRFVMLETIQEYAWERLAKSGEVEEHRKRHAQYYADLTTHAQPFLRKTGQEYWFPRLNIEYDNIRTALQWSLLGGDADLGLQMVDALQDFWFYEGYHIEGLRWAEQALEHLDDAEPLQQMGVLATIWTLTYVLYHPYQFNYLDQALRIAREFEYQHQLGWFLIFGAMQTYDSSNRSQQDYDQSVAMCEEGLVIFRKIGDKAGLAQGLNILGNIHRIQQEFERSQEVYQQCLALCYQTGEQRRVVMILGNLAKVAIGSKQYDKARQLALDTIALSQDLRFDYMSVLQLGLVAPGSLAKIGKATQAARLLGASATLREAMNIHHQPNNMIAVEQVRTLVHQQLGEEAYQTESEIGHKMSLDEAVEFALKELES